MQFDKKRITDTVNIDTNELIEHMAATPFRVRRVYHYNIPAGTRATHKAAPFPGFIFPISGCAQFHMNGAPYLISPGTILHGLADSVMQKRVVGDNKWEYIAVLYETYAEPSKIELAKTHFDLNVGQSPLLYDMLHQLHSVSTRPGGLPAFQVETLFRRVLEEAFICARNQTKYGAQELFEVVSEYIHAHYMDSISVSMLAEQNCVNENRLFYVFQKYAGMGPGDYLRAYRLNRAKELLATSSAPIGSIAAQTGYPDALYFSRIFKKHVGVSPSQFRDE
jgi:AraC-like DNA-binding protein